MLQVIHHDVSRNFRRRIASRRLLTLRTPTSLLDFLLPHADWAADLEIFDIILRFSESAQRELSEKYNHAYILKILKFWVPPRKPWITVVITTVTSTNVIFSFSQQIQLISNNLSFKTLKNVENQQSYRISKLFENLKITKLAETRLDFV